MHELKKPITEDERIEFIVQYNHRQGLQIDNGSNTYNEGDLVFKADYIFALEPNEMMADVEVEIDVPDDVEPGETQTYHKETTTVHKPVVNPDFEQQEAERREAEFNKAFFNTSLGYIRRSVTMADGSKKDFLSDLVLSIKAGLEQGLDVKILAYDKPPFDEDVTDWTEYQHTVSATPKFIMECLMQTANDFLPINEE